MVISEEDVAAFIADLERVRRETKTIQADLKGMQWEKELQKREYEAELEWLQSENVEMPMFLLLEGPQQSAPTAVVLAAEAPAAEAMTGTRVFPDTAAPDASVERAAIKLTSQLGPLAKSAARGGRSPTSLIPVQCFHWRSATITAAGRTMAATAAVTAAATAAAAAATTPPATTAHDGIQPVL